MIGHKCCTPPFKVNMEAALERQLSSVAGSLSGPEDTQISQKSDQESGLHKDNRIPL